MTMWVVIVLLCVLVGCTIGSAIVVLRRRQTSEKILAGVSPGGEAAPTAGSGLWAMNLDKTDRDESGMDATRPHATGIPIESLFRRSTSSERPRMDSHKLVAAEQQMRISSDPESSWRQTGRAAVHRALDDEVRMLDPALVQRLADRAFDGFVSRGSDVRARLDRVGDRVDLGWPKEAVLGYDGGVMGYFTPSLDPSYVIEMPRRGPVMRMLESAHGLSGDEILELVRTVALWLKALHASGVVFGDLGPRSIAYTTAPVRIRVLDYDTARAVGRGALLASDPDAEHDPLRAGGESSYDSDRFLFAQLAFHLLVTRTHSGPIAVEQVPTNIFGLDARQTARLHGLWQRAAGRRGTRPTLDEWVDSLGVPSDCARASSSTDV